MILLIDNYDSFVFNLARYVGELGFERQVIRNDAMSAEDVLALAPEAIILSPGPCTPNEAGISLDLVRLASAQMPILGVCLGHQTIAQAFGGTVRRAGTPRHGKASQIQHKGQGPLAGVPTPFKAARYHSLVADLPEDGPLLPLAYAEDDGELMALMHRDRPVVGFQFHPESVLSETGHQLIENFLLTTARLKTGSPA